MTPPGRDGTEEDEKYIVLPDSAKPAPEPEFELYPENVEAYTLFLACDTQWRVSMAGYTGLDYPAVESVMRMHQIPRKRHKDLLWRISCIERGALKQLADQRH